MSDRVNTIKKMGLLGRAAGLLALCGPFIATGPAFSQNATDQTTTAQTGAGTDVLTEVVVTAERRSTDIMTTPVSVVAVSGDQLQSLADCRHQ